MLSELIHGDSLDMIPAPLLFRAIENSDFAGVFGESKPMLMGEEQQRRRQAEEHLLRWGGMPSLLHLKTDADRNDWLRSYNLSYLERDLADLSRMDDLDPFRKFHTLAAMRCSGMLSYSSLANDAGISVSTARKYLEYLRISYQAFLLPPYSRNATSTAVKTPKLFWSDTGLMRQLTGNTGPVEGRIFENFVVAEVFKYLRTMSVPAEFYFYRTRSGLEVDGILKTEKGIFGLEMKCRDHVVPSDTTSLRALGKALGREWNGGIVVYRGNSIVDLGGNIWAVPSWRLLG